MPAGEAIDNRERFGSSASPLLASAPSWLFLVSGLVLAAATVLIPAERDRAQAAWQHERAQAIEQHARLRVARYEAAIDALDTRDPVFLAHLRRQLDPDAATPTGSTLLIRRGGGPLLGLDPVFEPPAAPRPTNSTLATLVTSNRSRLWIIAAAALCLLLGVLPPAEDVDPDPEPEEARGGG